MVEIFMDTLVANKEFRRERRQPPFFAHTLL